MERPRVGLGVIIRKDKKVLLGKRKGAHGEDSWSFPGGHLEMFESLERCAIRETLEETGLKVDILDKEYSPITTNDFFPEDNKQYITLFVRANYIKGKPQVMEPNKCEEWKWYDWKKLPNNLFVPIINLLKTGYNPFN